ncbi:exonuclease SbcCD subunit D [Thermoproteota archaeon]
MKFAHMADCHIGGWRDPRMQVLALRAFEKAIDVSISENVDFVLVAGDLFNTSIPSIDKIKSVVIALKRLKQKDIPIYIIPGSHDFSPSGKTMLDVLEEAELFRNVCRGNVVDGKLRLNFTVDKKTGAKITGMLGKKGMIDKNYYSELLRKPIEDENGFKIFMFHTAITELKTKELQKMESASVSLLPKNFDYYAGGHVHVVKDGNFQDRNNVVFPGPVFPNSFLELEKLKRGGMYIYDDGKLDYIPLEIKKTESFELDCNHKTPRIVEQELKSLLADKEFSNKIVTMRLFGTLESGRPSDIDLKEIFEILSEKKAYFVLKNTHKLQSKEFLNIKVAHDTIQEIEESLIGEEWGNLSLLGADKNDEVSIIKQLMHVLSTEKNEGETSVNYDSRVLEQSEKILEPMIDKR